MTGEQPPPPGPPAPDAHNPYGVPIAGPGPAAPPPPGGRHHHVPVPVQNDKALWSMVLGIGSILGVLASSAFCFFPFGLAAGLPAVVLGPLARKEIAASGGRQTGEGMAQAGLICGIIGIVLTVLVTGAMVVAGVILGISFLTADFS